MNLTLPDETEIVHSESIIENGTEKMKVCIEKPIDCGFKKATCWLPEYRRENVTGFSQNEVDYLQEVIGSLAATIYELAREGGFGQ